VFENANQIKPMYHLFLVCALFNHTFKVEDHLQQRLIIKSALCSMYNWIHWLFYSYVTVVVRLNGTRGKYDQKMAVKKFW